MNLSSLIIMGICNRTCELCGDFDDCKLSKYIQIEKELKMKSDIEYELYLYTDEDKHYPCSGDCETECSGKTICPLFYEDEKDPIDVYK